MKRAILYMVVRVKTSAAYTCPFHKNILLECCYIHTNSVAAENISFFSAVPVKLRRPMYCTARLSHNRSQKILTRTYTKKKKKEIAGEDV